jgi:hypothetical protein
MFNARSFRIALLALLVLGVMLTNAAFAADAHTSSKFIGPKANAGTVTHSKQGDKNVLTLSSDFVVPDTPDPHFRVIDSKGNSYDLDRLKIKNDKVNTSITLPEYVKDVKKVIIWCAFAEANLGEAEFATAVK